MGEAALKLDDVFGEESITRAQPLPAKANADTYNAARERERANAARWAALWAEIHVNDSLKANILRIRRPAFRGACWRAYVALHRAMDARREGDVVELAEALREAETWIKQAQHWDAVEVAL